MACCKICNFCRFFGAASARRLFGTANSQHLLDIEEQVDEHADMPQCFTSEGPCSKGKEKQNSVRVLTYGDSMTAGYYSGGKRFAPYGKFLAKELSTHFHDVEVWVCGLSGLLALQLADDQEESEIWDGCGRKGMGLKYLLEHFAPFDLVLLMVGTNDLGSFMDDPEFIVENVKRLHKVCHEKGTPTLALSVPDNAFASEAPGSFSEDDYIVAWRRVNNLLRKWSASANSVGEVRKFVNVAEILPWSRQRVQDGGMFEPDLLHFSPAGSKKLGVALADMVRLQLKGQKW